MLVEICLSLPELEPTPVNDKYVSVLPRESGLVFVGKLLPKARPLDEAVGDTEVFGTLFIILDMVEGVWSGENVLEMLGEELLWLAKVGEDGMPPELLTVAPELLLDRDEATEKPEDDMLNVLIPEDDIVSGTTELGGDTIDALGGGTVDLLDEIILDCVVTGPADELVRPEV